MEKYLLGIDVGTTGTKTILFDTKGTLIAHAYEGYGLSTPHVGYSEQSADDWWMAVCKTVREVCKDPAIGKNVAGISLSLQGGTLVAVDKDFRPIRPAIVWNDGRTDTQREEFLSEVGERSYMYEKTGWQLNRALLALEIRWMKDNEPENYAKAAMFLSVPDYVSYKMTGIPACDMSDAGINELCDIRAERYDAKLMEFAGVTEEQLPKLVHSGDMIGHLTEAAAAEMGLSTDCVLVAGAHDQYAVALGAGAVNGGDILIGSGTCWVVTAIGDAPDFESGLAQSVAAVPGKWGTLWALSSGGVCLDWLRKNVALGEGGDKLGYDTLNEEIAKREAAAEGLFFYPFSGRAAQGKSFSKATFTGLDLSHDRFHMARAVMEGVAFQVVWMLEQFKTKPSRDGLKLAGGASKSAVWAQILADIADLPIRIPKVADLACVGAAIMAGKGCGVYRSVEEGYAHMAVEETVVQPDPERAAMYRKLREEYIRQANLLGDAYKL